MKALNISYDMMYYKVKTYDLQFELSFLFRCGVSIVIKNTDIHVYKLLTDVMFLLYIRIGKKTRHVSNWIYMMEVMRNYESIQGFEQGRVTSASG